MNRPLLLNKIWCAIPSIPWSKKFLWPLLFWSWIIGVSYWLEMVPVQKKTQAHSTQQFSHIQFTGMRLEQKLQDNTRLVIHAPEMLKNPKSQTFSLQQPRIDWYKNNDELVFSATGTTGHFLSRTNPTSLPTDFYMIQLGSGTHLESKNDRVDSEQMLFDNTQRLFLFPAAFVIQKKDGSKLQLREMYFDPLTGESKPLHYKYNQDELKRILGSQN